MLKPVNENLSKVTLKDIEECKLIGDIELIRDLENLRDYDARENRNSFYGNPILYHYQLKNLLRCKRESGKTIYEIYENEEEWSKLLDSTRKRNRGGRTAASNVFECFRVNTGSIVMFKATTAKYIYQKYGAKSVLDPTAGWGGRMLGAWALGIDYVGIDTNVELRPAYDKMIQFIETNTRSLFGSRMEMIWESCLNVDFSKIDYDFVLTSPPYINMEIYEHMKVWNSDESFYKGFFLPLWEKCMDNMVHGTVCLNISPKMFDDALSYGLRKPDLEEDLLQQLGQQKQTKKQDKIYIWKK